MIIRSAQIIIDAAITQIFNRCTALAIVIFLAGTSRYRVAQPSGSVLATAVKVSRHVCAATVVKVSRHACVATVVKVSRHVCVATAVKVSRHACAATAVNVSRHACVATDSNHMPASAAICVCYRIYLHCRPCEH